MSAHQAPPSLGFSRQEHWSRFPFPSPMHESEKWKWSRSVVSDSWGPHGLQPTRLLHPWGFPGKSTGVGCRCLLRHSSYYTFIFAYPTEFPVWKNTLFVQKKCSHLFFKLWWPLLPFSLCMALAEPSSAMIKMNGETSLLFWTWIWANSGRQCNRGAWRAAAHAVTKS